MSRTRSAGAPPLPAGPPPCTAPPSGGAPLRSVADRSPGQANLIEAQADRWTDTQIRQDPTLIRRGLSICCHSPRTTGAAANTEQRIVYTSLRGALLSSGASKGRKTKPPHTRKGKSIAEVSRDTPCFRTSRPGQPPPPGTNGPTDGQRGRERQSDRQKCQSDTLTNQETYWLIDGRTDGRTNTDTDRHEYEELRDRQRGFGSAFLQRDSQAGRQMVRQTDRQTVWLSDSLPVRRSDRVINRQPDRLTDGMLG